MCLMPTRGELFCYAWNVHAQPLGTGGDIRHVSRLKGEPLGRVHVSTWQCY